MRYIIIVLLVILIAGGGYFLSRQSKDEDNTQVTSSPTAVQNRNMMTNGMMGMHGGSVNSVKDEKTFLEEMIPHHQEAITSSQDLLKVATTPQVQVLAKNIISAQEKEVAEMKEWYKKWYGKEYKPTGKYQPMMTTLAGKDAADAEHTYLMEMIMHHQEAIAMAQTVQPIAKHDEIKTLSQAIITTQTKEIQTMKGLLMSGSGKHM